MTAKTIFRETFIMNSIRLLIENSNDSRVQYTQAQGVYVIFFFFTMQQSLILFFSTFQYTHIRVCIHQHELCIELSRVVILAQRYTHSHIHQNEAFRLVFFFNQYRFYQFSSKAIVRNTMATATTSSNVYLLIGGPCRYSVANIAMVI